MINGEIGLDCGGGGGGGEVGLMLAGIEQKARQTADPDLHRHLPGFVKGVLALAEGKGSSVGKPS